MIGDGKIYHYDDLNDTIIPNKVLNNLFSNVDHIRGIYSCYSGLFTSLSENSFYLFAYDGYKAELLKSYTIGRNNSFVYNYENIVELDDSTNLIALDNGFILQNINMALSKKSANKLSIPQPVISSFETLNKEKQVKNLDFTRED